MPKQKPNATIPLVGKGRRGDFVYTQQQMGDQQGFRNVSQLWLNKCLTYKTIIDRIEKNRVEIEDFRLPLHALTPATNDEGAFAIRYEGVNFLPTQYALGHLATWAGVSSYDVEVLAGIRPDINQRMRNRPEDRHALITLLQSGFSLLNPNKKFLVRTQKDGTLRAMLSDKYEIIDNLWFLNILSDIIPNGLFSHWKEDGDFSTLWGNILIPDTIRAEPDSDYGALFAIGNSEIGRRKLHAQPSLFRAICMNGCIWDRTKGTKFNQVHRGKVDLTTLRHALREHLTSQIPLINQAIDTLLNTQTFGWDGAAAKPVFASLGEHFGLSKATNTQILEAWRVQATEEDAFHNDESLRRSAFGVINAVTRSAEPLVNPAEWVRRDELGGQMLEWKRDDWSHLFNRAKIMRTEAVINSFVPSVS